MDSVKLILVNNILYVKPWVPDLAVDLTCYRKKTNPNFRTGKFEVSYNQEPLYYIAEDTGITYAGMFERVKNRLKELDIKYNVDDRQKPLPEYNWNFVKDIEFRTGQEDIIKTILKNHRGVINAPTAIGKTFIIELLCGLYQDLKILIITSRMSVLMDIIKRVSKRNPDKSVCGVYTNNPFYPEADITVCSAKSLNKIDDDWPDLVLFDEVHGAAAPNISSVLSKFTKPRMFGFSASPTGRCDNADIIVETIFGPTICNISYQEAVENETVSPIEVWMLPVEGAEVIRTQPTSKDRWNIWRNRTRNDKIKEAVDYIGEEDQILILVSTVEHAFYLRSMLKDFTVIYGGLTDKQRSKFSSLGICSKDEPLVLDKESIKEEFRDGKLKRVISTFTWKEGVDLPDLKYLIRGDGTKGPIPATQIGGRLSRKTDEKYKGVVIDFMDKFGNSYLRRSKNRLLNYQKKGWRIVNGYGVK